MRPRKPSRTGRLPTRWSGSFFLFSHAHYHLADTSVACLQRIVDDVPRIIDAAIIRRLPSALSNALLKRLLSASDDDIKRLMAEPAALAEERAELNLRKTRLEDAKRVLVSFGRSVD